MERGEGLRIRIRELLMPGGEILGEPPRRRESRIRRVRGGVEDARQLFEQLAGLGQDAPTPEHPGRRIEIPGIGFVSYRPVSKTGPPTIDIRFNIISELENVKFKFVGREEA